MWQQRGWIGSILSTSAGSEDKAREARQTLFGHVHWKDSEYRCSGWNCQAGDHLKLDMF